MGQSAPDYFLFPHTTLSEEDCRRLSILVPSVSLLQVVRPPAVPEWAGDVFPGWPVLLSDDEVKQVSLYLRSCKDFAELHGEDGILACMGRDWTEAFEETRIQIQSELKGKTPQSPDRRQGLVLEASAFLEMARELDEREMEIDTGLARLGGLEEEFRKILGIEDDDDLAEAAGALSSRLVPDQAGLRFMLSRRAACWLRLFASRQAQESPVLIAVAGDIAQEIVEPARAARARNGEGHGVLHRQLATIPDPFALSPEAFQELRLELAREGIASSFQRALQSVLADPSDSSRLDKLASDAGLLQAAIDRIQAKTGAYSPRTIVLSLYRIDGFGISDLWRCIDRAGIQAWEPDGREARGPLLLLYLGRGE
ncbi:MAG: hypothetical protein ABFD98_02400 [Syntrophobacteraceae bacterium]|nr:hypothetical protein [Desulfobacteraceae bacterium]